MITRLQKYKYPFILFIISAFLIFMTIPKEAVFGSYTDWFSQHVTIADHLRKTIYEAKTLFPNYSALGGGVNFYYFSYYGFLRPDILISLLFPFVSMQAIIIAYSIMSILVSVQLCYIWLSNQKIEPFLAFFGSFLLSTAGCLFQFHRQIMFVNYLPFLFLALLSIDYYIQTQKIRFFILSFFFIFLHSFYFSVSCGAVCFLYLIFRTGKLYWIKSFLFSLFLAGAMAAILLIPTALSILENTKDVKPTSLSSLISVDATMKSLLYHHYGCGTTLICLYTLLLSIKHKATRKLGIPVFFCFFVNIISYLLNATLYVNSKILIPFLPLVLLLCTTILQMLRKQQIQHSFPLLAVCIILGLVWSIYEKNTLILLDLFLLFLWIGLTLKKQDIFRYSLLFMIPPFLFLQTNQKDNFVSANDNSQTAFSEQEIKEVCTNPNTRLDVLSSPLSNSNFTPAPEIKKSSMYSSVTNTRYNQFFYDVISNPIGINNRVALLPAANPFFQYLMGSQYLQTNRNNIPHGYDVIKQNKNQVLAQNDDVLPLAYASFNLMSESQFEKLSFPFTLDTISNNTIIPEEVENSYQSQMIKTELKVKNKEYPDFIQKLENGGYEINTAKEATFDLCLEQPISNTILILSFTVDDFKQKGVSITINGTKNKLSSGSAPYPNHNTQFKYYISSNEVTDTLKVTMTKGNYRIYDIETYSIDANKIKNPGIVPLEFEQTQKNEILKGTINLKQDGYFVTSIPYQNGYTAYIDGNQTDISLVNTAFIGFPLEAGKHEITICFFPPGKRIAAIISLIAIFVYLIILIKERKHHEKGNV